MLNICKHCNTEFESVKKSKFCSNTCRCRYKYETNKIKHKQNTYVYQKNRAETRRQLLIDAKGGKCEICGYSKCNAALEFHHLDPALKTFNLDARNISGNTLEAIYKEMEKCILVCANCHREIHNP